MKYCILLDALENKAKIVPVEHGEKLLHKAYELIGCDTVQLIPLYPDRLPKGYEAVCDENLWDKTRIFNPIASWLYGCDDHGQPISNNAVIFKVRNHDFCLMEEEEARKLCDELNAGSDAIFDLTMFAIGQM